jgi:hypothetical protein
MNVLNGDLDRIDWGHVQTVEPSGSPTAENCVRHPAIDGGPSFRAKTLEFVVSKYA